ECTPDVSGNHDRTGVSIYSSKSPREFVIQISHHVCNEPRFKCVTLCGDAYLTAAHGDVDSCLARLVGCDLKLFGSQGIPKIRFTPGQFGVPLRLYSNV